MDKTTSQIEFDGGKGEGSNYKVEVICNSAVYTKKAEVRSHLVGLNYLVSWKGYPKEKNTWEPVLAIQYL